MIDQKQNSIGALLSVGITTKGRLDELRETLGILQNSELQACNIILIDDGGSGEFVEEGDYELDLSIHRYEESKGLVARRNELAKLCQTKYIMSLDDDSAPESGSINDVLKVVESDDRVATIALNLYNSDNKPVDADSTNYESRYFVGCGHIHDVEVFEKLGGYNGDLLYGHEEREYALKLAKVGMKIIHMSNYVVKHRKSVINRVVGYNPRPSRNLGWVNGTYFGIIPNMVEIYSFLKGKKTHQILPCLKDYIRGLTESSDASKLSFFQYCKWKRKKTPTVA